MPKARPAAGTDIPADIAAMSFEAALAELEAIVERLEDGEVSLEDSIDCYSRGTYLKRHCEAKLNLAQAKIEKIVLSEAREPVGVAPLDVD